MQISADAVKKIGYFEGTGPEQNGRYMPYKDEVGYLTQGIGHLITQEEQDAGTINIAGDDVDYSQGLTFDQMTTLCQQDLQEAGNQVMALVKVPLTQHQYDALTSFAYNCGQGNLSKSTLLRYLNAGRYVDAANEFPKWNKAGGQVLQGLVARREWEKEWFSTSDNASVAKPVSISAEPGYKKFPVNAATPAKNVETVVENVETPVEELTEAVISGPRKRGK